MAKRKTIEELFAAVQGGRDKLEILELKMFPSESVRSMSTRATDKNGRLINTIYLTSHVSDVEKAFLIEKELRLLYEADSEETIDVNRIVDNIGRLVGPEKPELRVSAVIIPERKIAEGLLVKSASVVWGAVVSQLEKDWEEAYEISPHMWEEIVAGAYSKAGFDEVILTPRSGDYGRDIIAIRRGIGCIKIIGSVKAYKPGHLVKHDDVRALLGVMSGEQNTSKGIITTTSDFAPRISSDPFIKPFLPTRLEMMNGQTLKDWLISLAKLRSS